MNDLQKQYNLFLHSLRKEIQHFISSLFWIATESKTVIFLSPHSTLQMYVRCNSHLGANSSCDHFLFSISSDILFNALGILLLIVIKRLFCLNDNYKYRFKDKT